MEEDPNGRFLEPVKLENCVICKEAIEPQRTPDGDIFWTHGHNARPVAEGQCCDDCHNTYVLPKRLGVSSARFKEILVSPDALVIDSDTL